MLHNFSLLVRKNMRAGLLLIIALMMVSLNTVLAQKNGNISGRILDADTKEYLPGANVMLQGTTFGAATDRGGQFRISNVPPGTYTLVVSYIGYQEKSVEVTLLDQGYTLYQEVEIKPADVKMQEVQIVGLAQGQTKALSIQKSSGNIMNVVSEEQMEKFPDINSAEILQRIPGVSIERDQGEGRYVHVRGTEGRLNSMKINGEAIPSPEGGDRQVQMDIIPADQLSSIEVVKAITPDMDGDAIGGAVNLVTKSALDYEKTILNVTAGGGYVDLTGKGIYQGSFNYGTRLGDNKSIGVMIGGSYNRSDRGSHNNEMEWGNVDDVNDNEIPWALEDLSLRNYDVRRDRMGFSGSFDYKPDNDNFFSLKVIYDDYLDIEQRNQLRIRPGKGDFNTATDVSEAKILRHLKARDQEASLYSIMGKGENHFSSFSIDYALSYSYAQEKENRHFEPTFKMDEKADLTLNVSDPDNPGYTITNLAPGYEMDASHFELDDMEYHDNLTTNTDITASVNVKFPFSLGRNQAELKFGGKLSMKKKDRDENIWIYEWDGDGDILMSQFESDYVDSYLNDKYEFGPTVDLDKLEAFFNANKNGDLVSEWSYSDSDGGTYDATEDVYAFYLMTTINFDKVTLVAGVRDEITKTSYNGNEIIFDLAGDYEATNPLSSEHSYNHILPMAQIKLNVTPQTNIRAAFTSGLARANYEDLVPYSLVDRGSEQLEGGNPDLEPTTAYGFDLIGEHYFSGIGVISGGAFYKTLDHIIYATVIEQQGGIYDGYEIYRPWQPTNGGAATLYGFEFNWQQQLTFLPGLLDGFGIYANYTYTKSSADLPGRENSTLPGQAGNAANFAISYQKYGFTAQFSVNYQDSFIFEVGEDEEHDVYYKDHLQFDFTANQEIMKGLSAYLQLINLTNEPLFYYIGKDKENRPIQREFYSWWMQAGIKYSL